MRGAPMRGAPMRGAPMRGGGLNMSLRMAPFDVKKMVP